jgi:hypothetical protein
MLARALLCCCCGLLSTCAGRGASPTSPPAAAERELRFCLREGAGHNCLLRDATVAAHVVATSGSSPRLIVAFPAENSGAALWATPVSGTAELTLDGPPRSFHLGTLRGVRFALRSSRPLRLERVLLGSVRFIRDYHHTRSLDFLRRVIDGAARELERLPADLQAETRARGVTAAALRTRATVDLVVKRRRPALIEATARSLDGAHHLLLRVALPTGRVDGDGERLTLHGAVPLRLEIEAASTYPPYVGLSAEELLRPAAREHLRRLDRSSRGEELGAAMRSLSFLSTRRKFLAGSWRFLTYFGRDTLVSLWLLHPAVTPAATEAALQSVFDRLSPDGQVAHEESLGDQAAREHLERFTALAASGSGRAALDELRDLGAPVYDYKMIDDDFMPVLLLDAYLRDGEVSRERVRAFLGAPSSGGTSLEALARNLDYILGQAAPYAASGAVRDLIALRPGLLVGDWRDSEEGLGGGRYAASVNAYLVPAALEALHRSLRSSKIDVAALQHVARRRGLQRLARPDLGPHVQRLIARWSAARRHFEVTLTPQQLRQRLATFLARAPMPAAERDLLRRTDLGGVTAQQLLDGGRLPAAAAEGLSFDALSLDTDGRPIEVLHTDDGFALLAGELSLPELSRRLRKYELRYPLGLFDPDVGIYTASPVLSRRAADYATFDRGHYHGTVVWAWPLILIQRGLVRQLRRCQRLATPEAQALQRRLRALLEQIAAVERRVGRLRSSELWTASVEVGRWVPVAFGHAAGHADESNALQLWSALSLAVELDRAAAGL